MSLNACVILLNIHFAKYVFLRKKNGESSNFDKIAVGEDLLRVRSGAQREFRGIRPRSS